MKTYNRIELQEATNLTYNGLRCRLKLMDKAGVGEELYGKGGKRYWTEDGLKTVVEWKGEKPGRKRGKKAVKP